jgi:hypothetical protein
MYAGTGTEMTAQVSSNNSSAPEEKKGLLQHTQDAQDLL